MLIAMNPAQEAFTAEALRNGGFITGCDADGAEVDRMKAARWQAMEERLQPLGIIEGRGGFGNGVFAEVRAAADKGPRLLLADVLVPDSRVLDDKAFDERAALDAVEVNHFHAVFAQPIHAALEGAAFAHNHGPDAELANETAAIPAGSERGYHDQVAVARLAAGTAKGVGLAVDAGIALLYAAVSAAADELSPARE